MVQGINPIINNQPTGQSAITTPSQVSSQNTASNNVSKEQNMNMMPAMPMPAQVNMPQIELPPANSTTTTQDKTAGAQNLTTPAGNGVEGAVLNPPTVSNNPLQDRYGFIKDDLYGTKNSTGNETDLIPSQGLNLFPENSPYYNPDKSSKQSPLAAFGLGGTNGTKQPSMLGSIFKTTLFAIGGMLLFKSIKGVKGAKNIAENLNGAKNTVSSRIVKEIDEFKDFFTDTMANLSDLTPKTADNIKLNLNGRTVDETKDLLTQTRKLATEYSRLPGMRPKYVVYMKEGMEAGQDALIDGLKKNDLRGISDDIIRGIEEINLIGEKIAPSTELQNNILFNPVIRDNFSTHNNAEMFGLAGKNLRNRITNFLSR